MFSINIGYPTKDEEKQIVAETTSKDPELVDVVFSREDILRYQELVRAVPVSDHVLEYAVRLARASRPNEEGASEYIRNFVEWGGGPRASQYLTLGAKCLALLNGRPSPSCDDVRNIAHPVLQHRIIPNYNATGEGITSNAIVNWLLKNVQQPDYKS